MIADVLRSLLHASVGLTLALMLVFVLRAPARRAGGAFLAYVVWAVVPVAIAVSLMPAPRIVVAAGPALVSLTAPSAMAVSAVPVAAPLSTNWWLLPWAAGVGVCFGWLLWQQRRFVRSMGMLRPLDAEAWVAERGEGCPAVVGLLPPRLVLPHDFHARYGAQERELILAHERVHLARGDAYANAAAALLRCLFWFDPLMHLAVARFRQDQELACDAAVLQRFPRARRAYAEAMLKTQLADLGLPVGCHWQSSQPLRERILMLKNPLPGRARRTLGIAVVAALALGGGYAAWAAQPAVPVAATPAAAPSAATPPSTAAMTDHDPGYARLSPPAWPPAVHAKQGTVVVKVLVGVDGRPKQAEIERTTEGAEVFGDTALATVKTWTFDPARKDGKPVERWARVPLRFGAGVTPGGVIDKPALDELRVAEPTATSHAAATPANPVASARPVAPRPAPKTAAVAEVAMPVSAAPSPTQAESSVVAGATEDVSFRTSNAPVYPPVAVRENFGAKVVLKVQVHSDGTPGEIELVTLDLQDDPLHKRSQPPTDMQRKLVAEAITQSSIAAVKSWRFNPARHDGQATEDWVTVPLTFALTGGGT